MTEQFLYNFKKINESFNQVFSVLFDGGRADLILEDEQNILNCGIEIQAQPPGKKITKFILAFRRRKVIDCSGIIICNTENQTFSFLCVRRN